MRFLFSGNVEYLREDWLKEAFPDSSYTVIVPRGTQLEIENANFVPAEGTPDLVLYKALFDSCDYDYVFYFSRGLTPGRTPVHEAKDMKAILNAFPADSGTRVLYLRPAKYLLSSQGDKSCQAAEAVLRSTLALSRYVILGCPYLYQLNGTDPFFQPMYQALDRHSRDNLNFSANTPAAFLEVQELGKLLNKFCFEAFPDKAAVVELPAVQGLMMKDVADAASAFSKGWTVRLKKTAAAAAEPAKHNGRWLEKFYGWAPTQNIQKDLPAMFAHYRRTSRKKRRLFDGIIRGFQGKSKFLVLILELALTALMGEVCLTLSADKVQFSIIDYRLLFVVIVSSVFGLRLGIAAALIASVRLFQAYLAQGYDAMILFYEPTNWMGFIAYFLCGISCGFAHWSSRERTKVMQQENQLLTDKYIFLKGLYDDSLTDRDIYKEQILNSRDSYGKVLNAAQMLTANTLAALTKQIVRSLEYLLGNRTIGVYVISKERNAVLVASSAGSSIPQELQLDERSAMYADVSAGNVYMNTELQENCPASAIGVCPGKKLKLLVTVQKLPFESMTLAVQNLLKAMGEQITVAAGRAVAYETLMNKIS